MDHRIARHSAYFLIALLLPLLGFGQSKTYTIQDCIDIALTNNIDIKNSQLDAENARLNYRNSFGQKIPSLNLSGSQNINAGYTVDPFTNQFVDQTIRTNNFGLNSSLTLFAGNQINFTHSRLRSVWSSAQYSNNVTKNQIMLEVAQYYTAVLGAYKVEASSKSRLEKARKDRERILRRIEGNAAPKSDLADVESQIATEELNLSRATGDIIRQKLLLAQRMVLPSTDFELAIPDVDKLLATPADTNVESLYQAALSNLPDAKLARQNVVSAGYNEKVQRGLLYPTVTAVASVVTGYSSARTKVKATPNGGPVLDNLYFRDTTGVVREVPSSLFQNSTTYSSVPYYFKDQFSDNINKGVGVQANIPILNRLVTKNNIDNARIQKLKAQNEAVRTNQVIYNNVATAVMEYKVALTTLHASQKQVASLQTALQTAQRRLEAGAGSGFDLLAQQQLYAAAESNYIQQQFSVVFRRLIIDFYQGKPIQL